MVDKIDIRSKVPKYLQKSRILKLDTSFLPEDHESPS